MFYKIATAWKDWFVVPLSFFLIHIKQDNKIYKLFKFSVLLLYDLLEQRYGIL